MKTHQEMIEQAIQNGDKSLVKGKDLRLFKKTADFLENRGLSFRLAGSVAHNARTGRERQGYTDIDVVVPNTEDFAVRGSAITDLLQDHTTEQSTTGLKDNIVGYHGKPVTYVNTTIDNRFSLEENYDGRTTKVDLLFEAASSFAELERETISISKQLGNYPINSIMPLPANIRHLIY